MNVYKLSKPAGQVKEVQIKSFKMKFLLGMEADSTQDGTAIYKMLSTITDITDFNVFRQMTLIDSILILFAAWKKSYHKEKWINKYLKCDCGAMAGNLAMHEISGSYALPEVYIKTQEVAAYNDNDELQRFQIKLRPICLDLIEKGILSGQVNQSQMIFSQLESVDTQPPTEDLPMHVWAQAMALLPPDMDIITSLTQVKLNCFKCTKPLVSEIGFGNFDWLQGK